MGQSESTGSFYMNWLIIVLILLAIVGSMMWMMPSPRQRAQAILRQHAMRQGLQVQISRVLFPRALGEAQAEERDCVAYRLGRVGRDAKVDPLHFEPWQIFKIATHATENLPEGWSWGKGEGRLSETSCRLIDSLIQALPDDVYGVESTPVNVSVLWRENGSQATVDEIQTQLQRLITEKV